MRVDVISDEGRDQTTDAFIQQIKLSGVRAIVPSRGLYLGAFETALAVAQIYSFKKTIAVVKGNSPFVDAIAAWFLRDAFKIESTTWSALKDREAITAWVQALPKDTLYVITAEDHPVTAELSHSETLDEALNEKKLMHIQLSHAAFAARTAPLRAYSSSHWSVSDDLSLSLMGERFRSYPVYSQNLNWNTDLELAKLARKTAEARDEAAVKSFEANFPAAAGVFADSSRRLYDRAIVSLDAHGEAVIAEVKSQYKDINPEDLSTTNGCLWQRVGTFRGWWENSPSDEVLRGLVIVSARLCQKKDFVDAFRAAVTRVRADQNW